jgi:hypothetical protein
MGMPYDVSSSEWSKEDWKHPRRPYLSHQAPLAEKLRLRNLDFADHQKLVQD